MPLGDAIHADAHALQIIPKIEGFMPLQATTLPVPRGNTSTVTRTPFMNICSPTPFTNTQTSEHEHRSQTSVLGHPSQHTYEHEHEHRLTVHEHLLCL